MVANLGAKSAGKGGILSVPSSNCISQVAIPLLGLLVEFVRVALVSVLFVDLLNACFQFQSLS